MMYQRDIQVEFNHCDPAGIMFYPRYFEMSNSVVENFFAGVVHYPFARITMEEHCGVPTVKIDAEFRAPCRLGEVISFQLAPVHLGRSSVRFLLQGKVGGDKRMQAELTLVWVDPQGFSAPWPAQIREKLQAALVTKEVVA